MDDLFLDMLDIMDEEVENLSEEDLNRLIKRKHLFASKYEQKNPPCECFICKDWISKGELFYRIGSTNDLIICLKCAEPTFIKEDKSNDSN